MQRLMMRWAVVPLLAFAMVAGSSRLAAAVCPPEPGQETLCLTEGGVLDYAVEADVEIKHISGQGEPAAVLEIVENGEVCCGSNLVRAKRDSWVDVSGGIVHGELWAYGTTAKLFVSGGTVADSIWLYKESQGTVSDGLVGKGVFARYASTALVEGGVVAGPLRAHETATATLRGGSVYEVGAFHNASVVIEGGTVVGAGAEGAGAVTAAGDSIVTIYGDQFQVDGEDLAGFGDLAQLTPKRAGKLTGVLPTGEWLEVYFHHAGSDDSKTGTIILAQAEQAPPVTVFDDDGSHVVEDETHAAEALKLKGSTQLELAAAAPAEAKAMNIYSEDFSGVDMIDGSVSGSLVASNDSTMVMSGGRVGGAVYASDSSHVRIEGGEIVGPLYAQGDAEIEIVGLGFEVLGAPIPMGPLGDISLTRLEVSGTLASLEPMRNEFFHNGHDAETTGSITLVLSTEGSSALILNDGQDHVIADATQADFTVLVDGSTTSLNLTPGGEIQRLFLEGSTETSTSGLVSDSVITGDASHMLMTEGTIANHLASYGNSTVEIRGGTVGGAIFARNSSVVDLIGTDFLFATQTVSTTLLTHVPLPLGELRVAEGRIEVAFPFGPGLIADFFHAGADEFSTGTINLSLDSSVEVVLDDDLTHIISNSTYSNKRVVVKGNTRVELRGPFGEVMDMYLQDDAKLFLMGNGTVADDLVVADTAFVEILSGGGSSSATVKGTLAIYDSGRVRMRGGRFPVSFGISVTDNGRLELMGTNLFVQGFAGGENKPLDPEYEELEEEAGKLSGILESGEIVLDLFFQRDAVDAGNLGTIFTPEPGSGTLYTVALMVVVSLRRARRSR